MNDKYLMNLILRLTDRDISKEAKRSIVQEAKNHGGKVVKVLDAPNRHHIGMVNAFDNDVEYLVERETKFSIWVYDDLGIARRFTKDGNYAYQTGFTDDTLRTVIIM